MRCSCSLDHALIKELFLVPIHSSSCLTSTSASPQECEEKIDKLAEHGKLQTEEWQTRVNSLEREKRELLDAETERERQRGRERERDRAKTAADRERERASVIAERERERERSARREKELKEREEARVKALEASFATALSQLEVRVRVCAAVARLSVRAACALWCAAVTRLCARAACALWCLCGNGRVHLAFMSHSPSPRPPYEFDLIGI